MRIDFEHAELILRKCATLADAETQLAALTPIPSKATRWGVADGYWGRPATTSGLVIEIAPKSKLEKSRDDEDRRQAQLDYKEGYEIGRKIGLCRVPK